MYMLTNYGGSGLQVVTPDPPDAVAFGGGH